MQPNTAKDLLINLLFSKDTNTRFKEDVKEIGENLYKYTGSSALFITMELLCEEFKNNNYTNQYPTYLREIEWAWNGICEDFHA
jgi:hypothetical protein